MHSDIISASYTFIPYALFFCLMAAVPGTSESVHASATITDSDAIAALDQRAKIAEKEAATLTAENDLLKAQLGTITNSGIKGEAVIDNKAGKAEAMLLGSVALNEIANKFAVQIKRDIPAGATLLLFQSSESFDFYELRVFNTSYDLLKKQKEPTIEKSVVRFSPAIIASIGPVADMVKNMLSLFKTDYAFSGVDIELADEMLLSALTNSLKKQYSNSITVELPKVYNPGIYKTPDTLIEKLANLSQWANETTKRAEEAKTLLTQLAAIDNDKKGTMFSRVVQQTVLQDKLLKSNTYLVILQPSKLSGSLYTKKSLWSSLGSNPFYVMGGAVASYTVLDGISGKVISSMMLPVHGGYHSVSDIQRIVNGELSTQ